MILIIINIIKIIIRHKNLSGVVIINRLISWYYKWFNRNKIKEWNDIIS